MKYCKTFNWFCCDSDSCKLCPRRVALGLKSEQKHRLMESLNSCITTEKFEHV
jgi:hypothetical protein